MQPDESDLERDIADIRLRAQRVQEAIDKVRGRADTVNGAIAVGVDARGRLESLRLTPQALRLDPDELAAQILRCTDKAVEHSESAVKVASKHFSDDPRIRDALAAMKEFSSESQSPSRPTREVADDDYFEAMHNDPLGRRS